MDMESNPNKPRRTSLKEKFLSYLGGAATIGGGMSSVAEGLSMLSLTPAPVLRERLSTSKSDAELMAEDWGAAEDGIRKAIDDIDNAKKGKLDW
jgi:hypothetical protein